MTAAEAAGRPMALPDAQIAAIALDEDAVVATRNSRHFEPASVWLIDPWKWGREEQAHVRLGAGGLSPMPEQAVTELNSVTSVLSPLAQAGRAFVLSSRCSGGA